MIQQTTTSSNCLREEADDTAEQSDSAGSSASLETSGLALKSREDLWTRILPTKNFVV